MLWILLIIAIVCGLGAAFGFISFVIVAGSILLTIAAGFCAAVELIDGKTSSGIQWLITAVVLGFITVKFFL